MIIMGKFFCLYVDVEEERKSEAKSVMANMSQFVVLCFMIVVLDNTQVCMHLCV